MHGGAAKGILAVLFIISLLLPFSSPSTTTGSAQSGEDKISIVWESKLDIGDDSVRASSGAIGKDGSIYMVGDDYSNKMVIVKSDANGSLIWTNEYSIWYKDNETIPLSTNMTGAEKMEWYRGWGITNTSDGNIVLLGLFTSYLVYPKGIVETRTHQEGIMKIGTNGSVIWAKHLTMKYPSMMLEEENSLFVIGSSGEWQTSNGRTRSSANVSMVVTKIDKDGTMVWTRYFQNARLCSGQRIKPTGDSNMLLFGSSGDGSGNPDIWMIKISTDGKEIWKKSLAIREHRAESPDIYITAVERLGSGFLIRCTLETCCDGNWIWETSIDDAGERLWAKDIYFSRSSSDIYIKGMIGGSNYVVLLEANLSKPGLDITKIDRDTKVVYSYLIVSNINLAENTDFLMTSEGSFILLTTSFGLVKTTPDPTYDSDWDLIPDTWERDNFGDLGETGGSDKDGDGYTNLEEYEAGTDPNDPQDPPTKNVLSSPKLGIIIGVVVLFIAIVIIIAVLLIRRKKRNKASKEKKAG